MKTLKTVYLDGEILEVLNRWREEQGNFPSFSKAVEYFLKIGAQTLYGE